MLQHRWPEWEQKVKEAHIRAPSRLRTLAGGCHCPHLSAEEAKIREVKELAPITRTRLVRG